MKNHRKLYDELLDLGVEYDQAFENRDYIKLAAIRIRQRHVIDKWIAPKRKLVRFYGIEEII